MIINHTLSHLKNNYETETNNMYQPVSMIGQDLKKFRSKSMCNVCHGKEVKSKLEWFLCNGRIYSQLSGFSKRPTFQAN